MIQEYIASFKVIGISVRTTNENNQAATDIPALWERFMKEEIARQIPNKAGDDIYSIYTSYEKDHTRPYTTVLGCRVTSFDQVPSGMEALEIAAGNYACFTATGKMSEGFVFNEWLKIWSTPLPRKYTTDFEVYGAKAQDPEYAEVPIFIALENE
ncbi:GyrI-like domain-containing protein [Niabella drilacis]|uniref:Predicted transcriptional regulator YdeE, contains AraC-type DNA-binding domain n=1 Tax=Niabella drilacis (strain DSM 25811 / CCM 8410 / CCUG 62505 / LMG 26954 / E90) TaxID=1285928 RepID=A0A1G6L820_NIADE|nr:GyrI-like domain-containing protein [Niabella drilacis]SDC39502.1 Predicted transcriptional regulator YdeE, contains AraC-type DNA-binding domain [Niabella drilacis]